MKKMTNRELYLSASKLSFKERVIKDIRMNKFLYLMALPVIAFYIVFHYVPIYGAIIAFKNYSPAKGIIGSDWAGLKHFKEFFDSYSFWRVIKNTLFININDLIFGFPAPIILALLINEVKNKYFFKSVQTISYMPHFISLVVICGLIIDFTMDDGIINDIIALFGGNRITMLMKPEYFVPIYATSGIWQHVGWNSIIYLAALSTIDEELYEASKIDGAGRWRQTWHITLPGIIPTIIILLILRMGSMLNVGFEKIILLYNPLTYETADVISTFVYRKGLQELSWSFSSAVGLFNSLINFIFIITANKISRHVSETSLW